MKAKKSEVDANLSEIPGILKENLVTISGISAHSRRFGSPKRARQENASVGLDNFCYKSEQMNKFVIQALRLLSEV